MQKNQTETSNPLSHGLLLLMAIAAGVSVASNYYAQPLLHTISHALSLSQTSAGYIVTASQMSYGLGVLLMLPLADIVERRTLISSMILLSALGLVISALSPNLVWLLIGTSLTGVCSVAAQMLVPFAATLSAPKQQGRAIGIVMSGLLSGILIARIVAGVLSESIDWRAIYWFASVVTLICSLALFIKLPHYPSKIKLSYYRALRSTITLFINTPMLRYRSILGLLSFGLFSMFWVPLSFLLAAEPYQYNDAIIGLFGIIGLAGIAAATYAGKWADAGHEATTTLAGLILLLVSWLVLYTGSTSLIGLIIGVLVLDMAVHLVHISNQSVIFDLSPEHGNQINACYMTCYFIGGSLGSALSIYLYHHFNWTGVVIGSCVIAIIGLVWKNPTSSV